MSDNDPPPALEYRTPQRAARYSRRAVTAFVLAMIALTPFLAGLLLYVVPVRPPLILASFFCAVPLLALLSLTFGIMAFSHFPDDRGIMYRGRWMAIVGVATSIAVLIACILFMAPS